MMIGPESYYDIHIKGKSIKQIEKEINKLRKEITKLKYRIEKPCEIEEMVVRCPSDDVVLSCKRDYLERAIQALKDAGGTYKPSEEEKKDREFNKNIPFIKKIEYSVTGYNIKDDKKIVVLIDHDGIEIYKEFMFLPENNDRDIDEDMPIDKEYWLESLKNLHIGEWLDVYDPIRFGITVLDGYQWEVNFYFSNGYETKTITGINDEPYNFCEFLELLNCTEF